MTHSLDSLNADLETFTSLLDADFSDTELQWFSGGAQVIETINLVSESDIISEISH